MKKTLLTIAGALGIMFAAQAQNSYEAEIQMNPNYTTNVFFNLEANEDVEKLANSWDLAFYRMSIMNKGIRINDAKKLKVYEVSNNLEDWDTINISSQTNWNELHNSETVWNDGAFDKGSAEFGWGTYSPTTHITTGTNIFVIKTDGTTPTYTKIKVDTYSSGVYTFTYSVAEGNTWGEDITKTVSNTENEGVTFNYFSFATGELVDFEPINTEWDFLFTQYTSMVPYNGSLMAYPVTGVLQSPNVKVAQTTEDEASTEDLSTIINTVGYDWKTSGSSGTIIHSDINYFVKRNNSDVVYKVNFTDFGGMAVGNAKFTVDNSATLSVQEVAKGVSFDVYPNPSTDKIVNVVYDIETSNSAANSIRVYSLTGAEVYKTEANSNFGFYTQTLDLSCLSSGMYLLEFRSGDQSQMKKIILK